LSDDSETVRFIADGKFIHFALVAPTSQLLRSTQVLISANATIKNHIIIQVSQ